MIRPHEFDPTAGNPAKPTRATAPDNQSKKSWDIAIGLKATISLDAKEAASAEEALEFIRKVLADLPLTVYLGNHALPVKVSSPPQIAS